MIKLKTLLQEKYLGDYKGEYQVFENPKSIKRMDDELRAISLPNGNLLVIDDGRSVTHHMLALWLNDNGYNIPLPIWKDKTIVKGYIPWQRRGLSNDFYLGESIYKAVVDEIMPYLKKYSKKVKQKNSQYNFILKRIIDI